jgi:hypothetical protein
MKRSYRLILAAGTSVFLWGAGSPAQAAAPPSPVGNWDCLVSGKQGVGIAHLTFAESHTFSGIELLTVNPLAPAPPAPSYDGRNPGGDLGRGIYIGPGPGSGSSSDSSSSGSSGSASVVEQVYGIGDVSGSWQYDIYNRVIGYFVQVIEKTRLSISTNLVQVTQTVTNLDGSVTTTTEDKVEIVTNSLPSWTTNSVGFVGKVVPGKSLTLTAYTPNGKQVYTGRPLAAVLPDLSGSWYVNRKANGQWLVEFFEATPGSKPFLFDITGTGGGYTFNGLAMFSNWKRIGFVFERGEGTGSIRGATFGSFNPSTFRGQTLGFEEPSTRIRYNAYWYAAPAQ